MTYVVKRESGFEVGTVVVRKMIEGISKLKRERGYIGSEPAKTHSNERVKEQRQVQGKGRYKLAVHTKRGQKTDKTITISSNHGSQLVAGIKGPIAPGYIK